jgi:hypothetical protein
VAWATASPTRTAALRRRSGDSSAANPLRRDPLGCRRANFGLLALTVEVGNLDRRLWNPRRLFNPFCWMNPTAIAPTVSNTAPGVLGLLQLAAAGS